MNLPDSAGPLSGLKVIEFTDEIAPWAGKLLAEMGADVVRIEPVEGSKTRWYEPFLDDTPDPEQSLFFWHYNVRKRSVALDIETKAGRDLFIRLVADADILIEDQAPGRMAELGIAYDTLSQENDSLVHAAITPFGQSGPRATEPATDLTLLAGSGPAWSCGYDDHELPPIRGGGGQGYHTASHWAVISILTAIIAKEQIGRGQFIDINASAASNVSTEAASYTWLVAQETVQRQTGRHAGVRPSSPTQVQAADGRWINSGVPARQGKDFQKTYDWLVDEGLVEQFPEAPLLQLGGEREGFLNLGAISSGEDEEGAAIFAAGRAAMVLLIKSLPAYEYFTKAQERGFQCGIIYSPEEVVQDPHFAARGFPLDIEHPELGRSFTYPGVPYKFLGSPCEIKTRPPFLGEHTRDIMVSLEYSEDEIQMCIDNNYVHSP